MDDPVSAERDLLLRNYLHLASITFLYYDHFLTIIPEIRFVWAHIRTYGSVVFVLNRYLAFGGNIAVTVYSFINLSERVRSDVQDDMGVTVLTWNLRSCKHEALFRQVLLVVNAILSGAILTTRTYALWNRSRRILCIMLGFAAVLVAVSCWAMLGGMTSAASEKTGCHIDVSLNAGIHEATAWEALLIYDVLIFALTVFRTYRTLDMRLRKSAAGVNIVYILLRDGAMYFTIMAIATLANILTFYLADNSLRGVLSTFASSISVVMVSRLMLNLHHEAAPWGSLSRSFEAPRTPGTTESIGIFTSQIAGLGPRLEPQGRGQDVELGDIAEVRRVIAV